MKKEDITYRLVADNAELDQAAELEMIVWEMAPRDIVPGHMMQVISKCGGSVIGAFEGQRMVGFALALATHHRSGGRAWSHMAAVHPEYQSRGIGFNLKQAQRLWALSADYQRIGWSFDPFLRRNAHFNLRLLGAVAGMYHVNFYGEMRDGLNAGLPSDRLEIEWILQDDRVVRHADGDIQPVRAEAHDDAFLLRVNADQTPAVLDNHADLPWLFAEIPYDGAGLRKQNMGLVLTWREALRAALIPAFQGGYTIVDFNTSAGRCWYVLQRGSAIP